MSSATIAHHHATIATAIIGMAHNLNRGVIAEGVETPALLAFLRERGCGQIQGYLLGRPMLPKAKARFWQASPNQASQG